MIVHSSIQTVIQRMAQSLKCIDAMIWSPWYRFSVLWDNGRFICRSFTL